jgi:hypothetical protein
MATVDRSGSSPARTLGRLGRVGLGLTLLLLGGAMVFTLVLMPVGLPLALLGVALVAAES